MSNGLLNSQRFDDLSLLHPKARGRFIKLSEMLKEGYRDGRTRSFFLPFETYRTPQRQDFLLKTSQNTKVGPWGSSHQYGLACDFVPFEVYSAKWSWDPKEDWNFLDACAALCGLVRPISWDRVHIEHPMWGLIASDFRSIPANPKIAGMNVVTGYAEHHDDATADATA